MLVLWVTPSSVFWLAAFLSAPFWLAAVAFPRHPTTRSLVHSGKLPFIMCSIFVAIIMLRTFDMLSFGVTMGQWLQTFVDADLSLSSVRSSLAYSNAQFVLLWVYILAIDMGLYCYMHRAMLQKNLSSMEIGLWALVSALCMPLGYLAVTVRTGL